jgi:hypothetical protein
MPSIIEIIRTEPKSELFRLSAINSFVDQKDKEL